MPSCWYVEASGVIVPRAPVFGFSQGRLACLPALGQHLARRGARNGELGVSAAGLGAANRSVPLE